MNVWVYGVLGGKYIDRIMDRQIGRQTDRWTDGWMDGRMDRQMKGRLGFDSAVATAMLAVDWEEFGEPWLVM